MEGTQLSQPTWGPHTSLLLLRPQGHQGQVANLNGDRCVTWAKSTEATRLSCRVFWTWSQDRLRLSQGDLSLRMAAQRSWICSGHVGRQRVDCSRSTHVFSSLDSKVTVCGPHVTPLQGRPAPKGSQSLSSRPGEVACVPWAGEGTFLFEDLQHWLKWTRLKRHRFVPTCQAPMWRSHGGAC